MMGKQERDEALRDWARLNQMLMTMPEAEVEALLTHERKNRARLRIMLRLYHRYSKLRSTREKVELSQGAKG